MRLLHHTPGVKAENKRFSAIKKRIGIVMVHVFDPLNLFN